MNRPHGSVFTTAIVLCNAHKGGLAHRGKAAGWGGGSLAWRGGLEGGGGLPGSAVETIFRPKGGFWQQFWPSGPNLRKSREILKMQPPFIIMCTPRGTIAGHMLIRTAAYVSDQVGEIVVPGQQFPISRSTRGVQAPAMGLKTTPPLVLQPFLSGGLFPVMCNGVTYGPKWGVAGVGVKGVGGREGLRDNNKNCTREARSGHYSCPPPLVPQLFLSWWWVPRLRWCAVMCSKANNLFPDIDPKKSNPRSQASKAKKTDQVPLTPRRHQETPYIEPWQRKFFFSQINVLQCCPVSQVAGNLVPMRIFI